MSAVDLSGKLLITAGADDSIAILSSSGNVKIDGSDPGSGPFPSDGITAIRIVCTAATGADSNVVDLGDVTPSRFAALTSVSVDGGGGQNRLIGPDIPILWGITSRDAGILAGDALGAIASFTFESIGNLVGGLGDDTFVFDQGASLSGSIEGGGGNNSLDFGGVTDALSVTLTGSDSGGFRGDASGIGMGFLGIDAVIGGLGTNTLTGEDAASIWTLDGTPTYDDGNATLSFSQFGNLRGGSGADTFDLIGDSLGNLTENIDGGSGADRFLFEGNVTLTGTIVGGAGADTLDFSDYGIAVAIALSGSNADGYAGTEPTAFSGGGFQGINSIVGPPESDAANTIAGENTTSFWSLGQDSSYEDDSGRSLSFSGFEDVDGGSGDDTYQIDPGSGTALALSDAGGVNTLDFSAATFGVTIDTASPAAQSIGPGRTLTLAGQFDKIIGSPFPDAITIAGSSSPQFIEGGLPDTSPGDVLTFNAGGSAVTLTPTQILAQGLAPVTYSGIESVVVIDDSSLTRQVILSLATVPAQPRFGQSLTFTISVAATTSVPTMPGGTVQFTIDGVPYGQAVSLINGTATSPPIATLGVGPHTISATYSGDANFAANVVSTTTFDVAKAPLTISARDVAKVYGQANPAFTASYAGFVLGQDAGVLGGALTFATSATATSPPGTYAVTPSGVTSNDYAISYVAGTLTVTSTSTSTISGTVYLDLNASGSPVVGDPGLAGRVVFLDLNHDGTLDPGDPTATTDADGNFTLTDNSTGTGPVLEATDQDATYRYVVDQAVTDADGTVNIGVVPISPVAPVNVVPDPFSSTPSTDANTAYVNSLYLAVLGRIGADSEVATWLVKMDDGMTRQKVALGFVNSPEHRRDQVTTYYEEFLHRAPDPASVVWVNDLLDGVSEERVVERFLDSPEYQAAHQDSTLFIDDLYVDVLGRDGEATGIASWQADLASGATRNAVVAGFVESLEADDQIVQGFYSAFLRRQREGGTTSDGWVNMLEVPNGSATAVATGILDSPEFDQDATNPTG